MRSALRAELRPMFRLAWPVATAELGWMAMGLVDTMMVGRVGAAAIGAVSIGSHVFFTVAIFGMGILLGLDHLVAHAYGAGRLHDARRALVNGLALAALLAVLLTGLLLIASTRLAWLGLRPEVARDTAPYLRAVTWSLPPLLLYTALRRYLQALGRVRAIMVALITANLINLFVNWLLVFGRWGFPALGAPGSGWATCGSRIYMLLFAVAYAAWIERGAAGEWRSALRVERSRMLELVRLGLPAALHLLLEVGVFATATVLVGRLTADALAAHQVALSAAAFTFMVPLGISSAAAVRVGQALGRRDPAAAMRAGWTALLLGAAFMSGSAVVFLTAPRAIVHVFTDVPAVIATGVSLLGVAAAFQLFDGLQVVATGALRGTGDTRSAMLANLVGHWLLGLPVGSALCFWLGWGVIGLWIGLCTGLISVSLTLIAAWRWRTRTLIRERAPRHG